MTGKWQHRGTESPAGIGIGEGHGIVIASPSGISCNLGCQSGNHPVMQPGTSKDKTCQEPDRPGQNMAERGSVGQRGGTEESIITGRAELSI